MSPRKSSRKASQASPAGQDALPLLSESRFRHVLDSMLEGCQIIDYEWRYVYVNDVAAKHGRRKPEELLNHAMMEMYPGIENSELFAVLRQCMEERMPRHMENQFVFPDGRVDWFELSIQPAKEGIFILSTDITARKRAEEELRQSEERYRRFFENMHETFVIQEIVVDEAGKPIDLRYLDANPAAERILGKTLSEIAGRTRSQLSGQPDPEGVEMASRVASTGTPFHMVRYSPGFGGWFESFTYSLGSGIVATLALDITERKRAEEQLRESEERFSKSFYQSPIGIALTDLSDNTIRDVNDALLEMIGLAREQIVGHNALLLNIQVDPEIRAAMGRELRESGMFRNKEVQIRIPSGEIRSVLNSGVLITIGGKPHNLGLMLDITERKRAEEGLRRYADRLAAVSRLDRIISSSLEIDQVYDAFVQELARLYDFDRTSISLLDDARQQWVLARQWTRHEPVVVPGAWRPVRGSVVEWVVAQRQPLLERDIGEKGAWPETELLRREGIHSRVLLPLIVQGQVIGLWTLASRQPGHYGENDLDSLVPLADQLAIGVQNARLYAQAQRRAEQLVAVNALGRALSESLQLDHIFERFYSAITTLLPDSQTMFISLYDKEHAVFRCAFAMSEGERINAAELPPAPLEAPGIGTQSEAVHTRRPVIINDLQARLGRVRVNVDIGDSGEQPQSGLYVPMLAAGEVFGVVQTQSRLLNRYTESDAELVSLVANTAAVAIQNARLYAQVQQHSAELEERVQQRTAQLEAANKEMEAFSYSVSHDLRAPLRAIDGFSRILLEKYADALDPQAARYLKLVRANTQQMGQLVDDLLAFSRLSRQPLKKEAVEPRALVNQALAELRPEREGRHVEIVIGDLPGCQADPGLLKQVFVNLLANALKFTRRREVARIEIGCRPGEEEKVYFVKDNGVGFDMQYVHKLFGVFQRLHRAEEYEGTGVGLAIVQRIILRHGGRVRAEAELDRGATFYLTLGD